MVISEVFEKIPKKANQAELADLSCVFQFMFDSEKWAVFVDRGVVRVSAEEYDDPNVIISCSDEDFQSSIAGELSAGNAWMSGKVKVRGNMMLANRLSDLFGKHQSNKN